MQKTKKQNIFVEDLDIFLMSGDESDIFGPSGVCDKIHFRGVRGSGREKSTRFCSSGT